MIYWPGFVFSLKCFGASISVVYTGPDRWCFISISSYLLCFKFSFCRPPFGFVLSMQILVEYVVFSPIIH